MPTQTVRIPWVHLAVLVSQDTMAMDWNALVRNVPYNRSHSFIPVVPVLNSNDAALLQQQYCSCLICKLKMWLFFYFKSIMIFQM